MPRLALAKTNPGPLSAQKPEEFLKTEIGSCQSSAQNLPKWITLLVPTTGLLHMLCSVLSPSPSRPTSPCQCKFTPSHYCLYWLVFH